MMSSHVWRKPFTYRFHWLQALNFKLQKSCHSHNRTGRQYVAVQTTYCRNRLAILRLQRPTSAKLAGWQAQSSGQATGKPESGCSARTRLQAPASYLLSDFE